MKGLRALCRRANNRMHVSALGLSRQLLVICCQREGLQARGFAGLHPNYMLRVALGRGAAFSTSGRPARFFLGWVYVGDAGFRQRQNRESGSHSVFGAMVKIDKKS